MEKTKRERKANFTEAELRCLIEQYAANATVLQSKLNNSVTIKRKNFIWNQIADTINACGSGTARDSNELKKKWTDLKSTSIKIWSQRKHPKVGGVKKDTDPWYVDYILDILGSSTALLEAEGQIAEDSAERHGLFGHNSGIIIMHQQHDENNRNDNSMCSESETSSHFIAEEENSPLECSQTSMLPEGACVPAQREAANHMKSQTSNASPINAAAQDGMETAACMETSTRGANKSLWLQGRKRKSDEVCSTLVHEETKKAHLEIKKLNLDCQHLEAKLKNENLKHYKLLLQIKKLEKDLGHNLPSTNFNTADAVKVEFE